MTMGQNLLAVAAFLLLAHSVTADLIPTYRDEAEETGRIGVISVIMKFRQHHHAISSSFYQAHHANHINASATTQHLLQPCRYSLT